MPGYPAHRMSILSSLAVPRIPAAPRSIQKGVPLKHLLGFEAIDCLAHNIGLVHPAFDAAAFRARALAGLEDRELLQRGEHLARALHACLPAPYAQAVRILLDSLTPRREDVEEFGLAEFFHMPHSFFIATYGVDPQHNDGDDPFELSMTALYELTLRFSSEFAIRPFLIRQQERTLSQVHRWIADPHSHVRRLCSEGTRPRLPWGKRIPAFIADPAPTLAVLERLKHDRSLYVRRSVANHLGDIAKDHPGLAIETARRWLAQNASGETKWMIRHAVRNLAKKGDRAALALRKAAA
jgi:3-methyladenine DNA glycosylase AlkC